MIQPGFLLRERVERNYAAVMAGRYAERHAYVSQIPNTLGRHAEVALLDTIWRRRYVFGKLLGLELPEGTEYAGASSLHTVIRSEQRLAAFDNLNLFAAYQPEVSATALEVAKLDYPGIEMALQDLAIGGLALYEATGLLVDTSGQNNIVVADGEVRCLDGLPIAEGTAGDVHRITGQLQQITVSS